MYNKINLKEYNLAENLKLLHDFLDMLEDKGVIQKPKFRSKTFITYNKDRHSNIPSEIIMPSSDRVEKLQLIQEDELLEVLLLVKEYLGKDEISNFAENMGMMSWTGPDKGKRRFEVMPSVAYFIIFRKLQRVLFFQSVNLQANYAQRDLMEAYQDALYKRIFEEKSLDQETVNKIEQELKFKLLRFRLNIINYIRPRLWKK